jgi:hypothetical protein
MDAPAEYNQMLIVTCLTVVEPLVDNYNDICFLCHLFLGTCIISVVVHATTADIDSKSKSIQKEL